MKNKKAQFLIHNEKVLTKEQEDQYRKLYWEFSSLVNSSYSMICSMNEIADVIAGRKSLYALTFNEDALLFGKYNHYYECKKIDISEIKNFYGRSTAFYISDLKLDELKDEEWEAHKKEIYWFGDFDKMRGGAGSLLFTLSGQRINHFCSEDRYDSFPRPKKEIK